MLLTLHKFCVVCLNHNGFIAKGWGRFLNALSISKWFKQDDRKKKKRLIIIFYDYWIYIRQRAFSPFAVCKLLKCGDWKYINISQSNFNIYTPSTTFLAVKKRGKYIWFKLKFVSGIFFHRNLFDDYDECFKLDIFPNKEVNIKKNFVFLFLFYDWYYWRLFALYYLLRLSGTYTYFFINQFFLLAVKFN